jgi:hypothetical protein
MPVASRVFESGASWERLAKEVCEWINSHKIDVVSISQSEAGRTSLDTFGSIIVWYRTKA